LKYVNTVVGDVLNCSFVSVDEARKFLFVSNKPKPEVFKLKSCLYVVKVNNSFVIKSYKGNCEGRQAIFHTRVCLRKKKASKTVVLVKCDGCGEMFKEAASHTCKKKVEPTPKKSVKSVRVKGMRYIKKEAQSDAVIVTTDNASNYMAVVEGLDNVANGVCLGKYFITSGHYMTREDEPLKVGDNFQVRLGIKVNNASQIQRLVVKKIVEVKTGVGDIEAVYFSTKPSGLSSYVPSTANSGLVSLCWFSDGMKVKISSGNYDGTSYNASTEEGACGAPVLIAVNNSIRCIGIHNATSKPQGKTCRNYMIPFSSDFLTNFQ